MKNQKKLNEEIISCIVISMLDLLKVKDFDKISIIEIIEHAGVSRNSFYRNFKSKEELLQLQKNLQEQKMLQLLQLRLCLLITTKAQALSQII